MKSAPNTSAAPHDAEAQAVGRHLCFAVCTAKRPKMLRACLGSIARQEVPGGWRASVVVVENDTHPLASTVFEDVPFPENIATHYVLEANPGTPFARNRSIEKAVEIGADWIAFIDDDEMADSGWIMAMVAHANSGVSDAYYGPVAEIFPDDAPDWIAPKTSKGKHGVGEALVTAATNNALVSSAVFKGLDRSQWFDERLRFSGGTDGEFFSRIQRAGVRISWIEDALVYETVSPNRLTVKWQVTRAFRVACNIGTTNRRSFPLGVGLWRTGIKSIGRLGNAVFIRLPLALSVVVVPRYGKSMGLMALKHLATSAGLFAGFLGYQKDVYRKTDGY